MNLKKILFTATIGLSGLNAIQCNSPKKTTQDSTNIAEQTQEVSIKEQAAKGAFLVDVRTPSEFSGGSVKGAVNIPLDEVESRVAEFKGKPSVIVFCRSGNRSGKAKDILEAAGVKNVTNGINVQNMENELK